MATNEITGNETAASQTGTATAAVHQRSFRRRPGDQRVAAQPHPLVRRD